MKRKIFGIIILMIVLAGWLWRVVSLNAYWKSRLKEQKSFVYHMDEIVPFEQDQLDKYSNLEGYSICVTDFQIMDYEDFEEKYGESKRETSIDLDRKVGLIYMTLYNADNDSDGITLTSFRLQSIDNLYMVDTELLTLVNPTLQKGDIGFRLPQDSTYNVVIPFRMLGRSYFGDWSRIDQEEMYLRMTSRPSEKIIKIQ